MNRSLLDHPFDPAQIKQRKGRNGRLDYVEGHTVLARLNAALDGAWSFEDEQAEHPLALAHGRARIVPHAGEIPGEGVNAGAGVRGEGSLIDGGGAPILVFGVGEPRERVVPLSLQTIGDEAMLGPDEQELPLGQFGVLPGALDLRTAPAIDLGLARPELVEDLEGHVEGSGGHGVEDDCGHGRIDACAGHDLAGSLGLGDGAALAEVVQPELPLALTVADGQAVAAAAAEQECQKVG